MYDKNKANLLLDYYGSLLTKHQLDILDMYFKEDYSLSEISENTKSSRSNVSDIIKRSMVQLESYEKKLNLLKQANKLDKIIVELNKGNDKDKALAKKLINIYRR